MHVPFVDLKAQYLAYRAEFDAALQQVIDDAAFIGGRFVQEFERAYAAAYGVRNCVSVANGTDAIYVVLRMLGIGPGDEVITTAASWISTSEAVGQTGATPVFVDVDEYFNIDVVQVERRIGPRTRALLPVHLYGQAAQVEVLAELARRHGLHLIEDCAQAHFAERDGRRVGTFGVAGTFSFYPGKNLGAYGDAGAIVTNDDEFARRCRMFANHGALVKHDHQMEGINSRLDGLQASLLTAKLRHLDAWTAARRTVAGWYDAALEGIAGIELPRVRPGSTHVHHLYVIRTDDRDGLKAYLAAQGIETAIHYPVALPLMPAYRHLAVPAGDVPRAAANQQRILSLPIYPEMTRDMVEHVAAAIRAYRG